MAPGHLSQIDHWHTSDPPDIYFTRDYFDVSASLEPDFAESVLLQWQDDTGVVYLPLLLRTISDEPYFDATNAYGHGGPWLDGEPNLSAFRCYLDDWARQRGVVSSFIQFHPLLENGPAFASVLGAQKVGQTIAWNLNTDDLVGQMAANHRRNWRKADRAGVEARLLPNPSNSENFRFLYEISMQRLGVKSFYWFPEAYWSGLQNKLGDRSLQVDAVYQGRTVASVWCLLGRDYMHFHLNGATDEGRDLRGTFIAHVAAAEWGRDQGYKLAHLGGGSDESLLNFKQRFDPSSARRDFYTAKIIHDQTVFSRLSQGLSETRFFPPWRAPV